MAQPRLVHRRDLGARRTRALDRELLAEQTRAAVSGVNSVRSKGQLAQGSIGSPRRPGIVRAGNGRAIAVHTRDGSALARSVRTSESQQREPRNGAHCSRARQPRGGPRLPSPWDDTARTRQSTPLPLRTLSRRASDGAAEQVKQILVAEAGGRCQLCGYERCSRALGFHHVDPASKSFTVAFGGLTRSIARARAEVGKCVLLCANCHMEVEAGVRSLADSEEVA